MKRKCANDKFSLTNDDCNCFIYSNNRYTGPNNDTTPIHSYHWTNTSYWFRRNDFRCTLQHLFCYFIYDYWWHWCSSFFTNDWRIGYIIWTNRWIYYGFHPYRLLYRQIFRDHQFYDYKCYYR